MKTTKHGEKRIRQRAGVNKKSIDKLVQDLERDGIPLSRLKGNLHKWVVKVTRGGGRGFTHQGTPYIFRNNLYVTRHGKIITIIPIPHNLLCNLNGFIRKEEDSH